MGSRVSTSNGGSGGDGEDAFPEIVEFEEEFDFFGARNRLKV